MTLRRTLIQLFGLGFALAIPVIAHAQWHYDEKVMPLLPPYCKYTQLYNRIAPGGDNASRRNYWSRLLGPENFFHLHHYCWALEDIARANFFARNAVDRRYKLEASLTSFEYVIARVKPDFVLLPEILTKQGETLLKLGKSEGVTPLIRAIELKPDYWPPYAVLSDYFQRLGDLRSAREWLEKGIPVVTDTKPLVVRLKKLATEDTDQSKRMPGRRN